MGPSTSNSEDGNHDYWDGESEDESDDAEEEDDDLPMDTHNSDADGDDEDEPDDRQNNAPAPLHLVPNRLAPAPAPGNVQGPPPVNAQAQPAPAPGNVQRPPAANAQVYGPQPQAQPDIGDDAYLNPQWLKTFSERCGPLLHDQESTAWEIFQDLLPDEAVHMLARETNRYADQYFASKGGKASLSPCARARRWENVDKEDIRAFLGLILFMGMVKLPSYEMYWNKTWMLRLGMNTVMARDKFLRILSFLHCADNTAMPPRDAANFDRLFKVRDMMDLFINSWKAAYTPKRDVAVDETVLGFCGTVGFKQYNPAKPHKWGLNVWSVAESQTGYVYQWDVYTGKPSTPDPRTTRNDHRGQIHYVVMDILEKADLFDKGYHVYMDNLFTSPNLYNDLADKNTGACGTLRRNRFGTPEVIKRAKPKKGEPPIFHRDGKLLFTSWMDRNLVNVCTTIHNDTTMVKRTRSRQTESGWQERDKPKAVELYTRYMRGVDLADQAMWYCLLGHRSVKWWKKILFGLLEVTFTNTLVIYRNLQRNKRLDRNKIRMEIITELTSGYRHGRSAPMAGPQVELRFTFGPGMHQLEFVTEKSPNGQLLKPDCVVCSSRKTGKKRHQVTTQCRDCKVALCPVPCAYRWHSIPGDAYRVSCYVGLHSATAQIQ